MSSTNNKFLPIGGFIKQSLIDYPGNISSVIFTQGCNFRCIYCHNQDLIWPKRIQQSKKLDIDAILNWIFQNKLLLDAVVITGGEPTMHSSLENFIIQIKNLGLKVKLDSNGTNPDVLQKLIAQNLVDYIAMDVKAPVNLEEYKKLVGEAFNKNQLENIKRSIEIIKNSRVEFEFRTTVLNEFHTTESIEEIAAFINSNVYLQNYKSVESNDTMHLRPFKNLHDFVRNSNFSSYFKLRE